MEKFAFAKENIPKNSNIKTNQIKYLRTSKIGLSRFDIKKFINYIISFNNSFFYISIFNIYR